MKAIITLAMLTMSCFAYGNTQTIYVESGGKTLQQAVKESTRLLSNSDVNIVIKGGFYPIDQSINLPQGDKKHRLTIMADEGAEVTLFGGVMLNSEWFTPLKKGNFSKNLIDKEAASKIVVCDLFAHDIKELGEITTQAWSKPNTNRIPPAILTVGGERMTLARYPNEDERSPYLQKKHFTNGEDRPLVGYEIRVQEIIEDVDILGEVGMVKVIDAGDKFIRNTKAKQGRGGTFEVAFDRMKYWSTPSNIFVNGVFNSTWEWSYNQIKSIDIEKKHITLKDPELNPLGGGESVRLPHFHFENIPEEIDVEGEYFIDRDKGLLYLYPTSKMENIVLATLKEPIFIGSSCSNITIKGITVDTGRNLAFKLTDARGVEIEACQISNFVKGGVELTGKDNLITKCHIYGIGGCAVAIDGGDHTTLESGNNVISNCRIHDFGWDQKSQMPGVLIDGVGHRLEHCDISDGTHFGIRLRDVNDVVVEYNKIHNLPTYHHFDGGALYHHSGRSPQMRGNIIRHNYFHDVPTIGIYPDNYTWGTITYGNIFQRVGVEANRAAVNVNGGGDARTYNNIMIDCPLIYNQGRHSSALRIKDKWIEAIAEYGDGKLEQTPHRKYDDFRQWLINPDLHAWLAGEEHTEPKKPFRGKSYVYKNLLFNPNVKIYKDGGDNAIIDRTKLLVTENNWITDSDPGFVNFNGGDLNLREDSEVYKIIEGFEPIPFREIGVVE